MTARIALALGRSEWESRLTALLAHPATDVIVARRCVDGDDFRASAPTLNCAAVVVSDTSVRIDRAFVTWAAESGVRVLAVSDDQARWTGLGVREVFPLHGLDVTACSRAIADAVSFDAPATGSIAQGTGVCVGGFGGAASRTSVARELARALAVADGSARVLLADADVYSPGLAQVLGVAQRELGLLAACRAVESGGAAQFGAAAVPVSERVDLLPGLARASRWGDLRRAHLDAVWQQARTAYSLLVADIGPVLEADAAGRAAAAHSLVAACDSVVLCCRADTVGAGRLVRGYAECESLLADKHITVVAIGATGRREQRDMDQTVLRLTGLQSVVHIPARAEAFARAEREGSFAALVDKESARAFDALARQVLPSRVIAPRAVSTRAIEDYLRPRAA